MVSPGILQLRLANGRTLLLEAPSTAEAIDWAQDLRVASALATAEAAKAAGKYGGRVSIYIIGHVETMHD